MNKFKSLFRSKSNRKEDELSKFMSFHERKEDEENRVPSKSGKSKKDSRDVGATACYYTDVAPKTKRGPKSCPGGYKDEFGIDNRSFETEIRRREHSPDMARSSVRYTREKRSGRTMSEYGGDMPSKNVHSIPYRQRIAEEPFDSDEDIAKLRQKNEEIVKRWNYARGRYAFYKSELKREKAERKREEQMHLKEIEDLKNQNRFLEQTVRNLDRMVNTMGFSSGPFSTGNYPPMPNFAFNRTYQAETFQFNPPEKQSSVISDPQHTQPIQMQSLENIFKTEDRDETKNFRCRDSFSPSLDRESDLLTSQALRELQQNP